MELERTLNPTCTGTTVVALAYDGGVAVMADRLVSYGKMARYKHVSRQYRVNNDVVVAFSGDHADFQWLQNVIERQTCQLRAYDPLSNLSPQMLHAYLTSLLYFRRSRLNPVWNTLIVAGMQMENGEKKPFIGVITPRGVAYRTNSVATGIGAMLLNQVIETEVGNLKTVNDLTKNEAVSILKKAFELTIYHDCVADNEFEITTVDKDGVTLGKPETLTGNWDIAEYNCDYD
uniref:Proteasome subunit beta n=1 Tax=Syphacia muris TaxID=451379 RepID=A0A0N5AW27_9BILA